MAEEAVADERAAIVAQVRAQAEKVRADAWEPSAGIAMGALVDNVADKIEARP